MREIGRSAGSITRSPPYRRPRRGSRRRRIWSHWTSPSRRILVVRTTRRRRLPTTTRASLSDHRSRGVVGRLRPPDVGALDGRVVHNVPRDVARLAETSSKDAPRRVAGGNETGGTRDEKRDGKRDGRGGYPALARKMDVGYTARGCRPPIDRSYLTGERNYSSIYSWALT